MEEYYVVDNFVFALFYLEIIAMNYQVFLLFLYLEITSVGTLGTI